MIDPRIWASNGIFFTRTFLAGQCGADTDLCGYGDGLAHVRRGAVQHGEGGRAARRLQVGGAAARRGAAAPAARSARRVARRVGRVVTANTRRTSVITSTRHNTPADQKTNVLVPQFKIFIISRHGTMAWKFE